MGAPRIFCIGFNKCGTTSLSHLFASSGIASFHWGRKLKNLFLAKQFFHNFSIGRPLISGLDEYRAFSVMNWITEDAYMEANLLYKVLHKENPESYFVLNTRDLDAWIKSRVMHPNFLDHTCKQFRLSKQEVVQAWRAQWISFHSEVEEYFATAAPEKFVNFHIETDDITRLTDFLGKDFSLNSEHWRKHNASTN